MRNFYFHQNNYTFIKKIRLMKHLYFSILSILFSVTVFGQIAVTNTTFPKVGDELKFFIADEIPEGFTVGTPGDNKIWNFNSLTGGTAFNQRFLDKSAGTKHAEFPDANMLIKSTDDETELYARSMTNRIEVVGFSGPNPLFDGELTILYDKRPQIRRAPMYYETTGRSEGEFRVQLSSSVIPDTLLSQLPFRPDSIRISFTSVANDTLDAWGKVLLGGKEYDVLREKSYLISETKVFLKFPFLGWIDLSAFLGEGEIDGFLGADTTITYNYYTNTLKEVLVSVDTDFEGNIFGITYVNTGTVRTDDIFNGISVQIYPNPASQFVSIRLDEGTTDDIELTLNDYTGKLLLKNTILKGNQNAEINVSSLSSGIYVLRGANSTGEFIFSKKIVLK
jgi:hypothetical protein